MTGRGGECVRVPGAALQQPAGQAARLSQLRHHHPLLSGRSPLRSLRQVNFYTKFHRVQQLVDLKETVEFIPIFQNDRGKTASAARN